MSESGRPVVLCLAETGLEVAACAAQELGAELCVRKGVTANATQFSRTAPFLREVFLARRSIVGVCAVGILIRALAPCLGAKRDDPPVVAGSETGSSWIPLLGGHRGANALASRLAAALGGHAAITTAGDLRFGAALDEPPPGWSMVHGERAGPLMASLLAGGSLSIGGPDVCLADWLTAYPGRAGPLDVVAGMGPVPEGCLGFVPRRAALGVGCIRGCAPDALQELAGAVLEEAGIVPEALCGVFSLDLKADEPAVVALAKSLRVPARFFSATDLEAETQRVANPSKAVFREVGCHSVAEAAALAGAGRSAALRIEKRKCAEATCALAIATHPITDPPGRSRGRLMLVSAGPGAAAWRTPEASGMIAQAEELVGYGPYIELLGPTAKAKAATPFPIGAEEDRCRYAIERAAEGRRVALVCSGDAGIYAMASLVFEMLDRDGAGLGAGARAVEVVVGPGLTAASAAAARIGAPLGHDFCAISLSDLLTPRETILNRVTSAATGDYVIAFYNPASRKRRTLLEEARDVLLRFRPPETPVAIARSVGRSGESIRLTKLESLQSAMADMHCIILVGSRATRWIRTPDGTRMYTPRGYGPPEPNRAPA